MGAYNDANPVRTLYKPLAILGRGSDVVADATVGGKVVLTSGDLAAFPTAEEGSLINTSTTDTVYVTNNAVVTVANGIPIPPEKSWPFRLDKIPWCICEAGKTATLIVAILG